MNSQARSLRYLPFVGGCADIQPSPNQTIRIKLPYIDITTYAKGVGDAVVEREN
jgi:hypothetical protein